MRVVFLGIGNMGSALLAGAIKAQFLESKNIVAYDKESEKLAQFCKETNSIKAESNLKAVQGADYLFLCVKPQQMGEVLKEIGPGITAQQCLVSIAAGIKTSDIESFLEKPIPVVRAMPNTPALVGLGMTAITKGKNASQEQLKFAGSFFASVGKVVVLEETHFDAVTAVSGSGPAYFFYLTEILEEAAKELGLESHDAKIFSRQTCLGAAAMLQGSEDSKILKERVTSPGGTTEAALNYLKEKNWQKVFKDAVRQAKERSQELSSKAKVGEIKW